MKRFLPISLLVLFLNPLAALQAADVLVLVHGYASDASSWQRSGVTQTLEKDGWKHANSEAAQGDKVYYLASVPTIAPLMVQSNTLNRFLTKIRERHADDALTVVGHSAGGVVSRLAVLDSNPAKVDRLITIAAPHLGTGRALQGLNVLDDSPFFCPGPGFSILKSVFGGSDYDYLDASRPALVDMLPAGFGSVLDWANQQAHPDIEYHAVVRQHDQWVPAFSQDMNRVPSLKGKAKLWIGEGGHYLHAADGQVILNILAL